MGKFVFGVLLGVAVVVGAVLLYQSRTQKARPQDPGAHPPPAAIPPPGDGPANPPPGRGGDVRDSGAAQPVPAPQATAAQLLAAARSAPNEADRLKGFERLAQQFPTSPEAAQARETLAKAYRAAGDAYALRNVLSDMLWKGLPEDRETAIKREIATLNEALIFSRRNSPDGEVYTIQPGDSLTRIAGPRKITPAFIGRINGLKNLARIRYGDTLKVVDGPFDALVEVSKFRLTLLLKGRFVKEYRIGVGKDESTPIGSFTVTTKLTNPTWYNPEGGVIAADDPANPLGEHWIGISGGRGYGLHGTIEPETIGAATSRGCIRMLAGDIAEVYDFLVENHSRVTIVE